MPTETAFGNSRLLHWLRVREFAVPPSMIETATARRIAGDWAGACAAAGVDVDLDLRAVTRAHGGEVAARLRADLRLLAPDLLRWHLPRTAPDGFLRPGTTVTLAQYGQPSEPAGQPVRLVARTAPAWAGAGQRVSLAVGDDSASPGRLTGPRGYRPPDRRFRMDLHRHLWDAGRSGELPLRAGAVTPTGDTSPPGAGAGQVPAWAASVPGPERFALGRWADEAALLLRAEGRDGEGRVAVRLGARRRLLLDIRTGAGRNGAAGPSPGVRSAEIVTAGSCAGLPVLPDAATWVLPDLELLRGGWITADRLHPLVAEALAPGTRGPGRGPTGAGRDTGGGVRIVDCRGARHRIGLVDGVLVALDHDAAEIHREELLAAFTGTPLPCLQVIDLTHRRPDELDEVLGRLAHGDSAGAMAQVEGLLGVNAQLREGELRDALEEAAERRLNHGLFRSGLAGPRTGPGPWSHRKTGLRDSVRSRPRAAASR